LKREFALTIFELKKINIIEKTNHYIITPIKKTK